jgi:hypothetical protein
VRLTSGELDKAKHQITWQSLVTPRPVGGLFFALWSAPDTAWQTQHFGRVALRAEVLPGDRLSAGPKAVVPRIELLAHRCEGFKLWIWAA